MMPYLSLHDLLTIAAPMECKAYFGPGFLVQFAFFEVY
jgi:hypothetical protein